MSYQVIARKYRPQTFEEVVGQRPIVTTLRNAVEQQRIHHAYLFSGPRGVGKTTVARLLAKALNCVKGPTSTPCNACASCAEITQSRSLDVLEIDGASNRGIDNIRELRETVRYTPARDRYKVFIIDEVHMLTDPAWNALLKTLEEPPPNVVFLFATTEYREIPRTILSRCQHFEFKKVAPAELQAHLAHVAAGEKVTVEASVYDLIVRVAEGSLRDALSALDQVVAFSGNQVTDEQARVILGVVDRELIVDFFAAIGRRDCGRLVAIVDTVFEKGYQPVEFLEDLMAHARDLLLARTVPQPERYLAGTKEEIAALVAGAAAFGEDELLRILELMTREEFRIKNSTHARFLLEALGIKLARLADLEPIEALLARIDAGGGPAPSAGGNGPDAGSPPRPRTGPSVSAAGPGAMAERGAAVETPTLSKLEASPEPATAAPPPVSGSDAPIDPPTLVEAILERVHRERSAIGGMLDQAASVRVVGDALQILFGEPQAFFREKVKSREVSGHIARIAREIAGRDLRVVVETATPGAAPAARAAGPRPVLVADRPAPVAQPAAPAAATTPPADARPAPRLTLQPAAPAGRGAGLRADDPERRALLDRAQQEPGVRSLLDLFGGEIIDIEPI
jgi:DNA polymerase III subunit gamma/tau